MFRNLRRAVDDRTFLEPATRTFLPAVVRSGFGDTSTTPRLAGSSPAAKPYPCSSVVHSRLTSTGC